MRGEGGVGDKNMKEEVWCESRIGVQGNYLPQENHPAFFFSGAGLYSFCISPRSTSNALPSISA